MAYQTLTSFSNSVPNANGVVKVRLKASTNRAAGADAVANFTVFLPAPADLTASSTSGSSIELHWTDNTTNEDSFQIHRNVDDGPYELLAETAANTTTYSDTAVVQNRKYTYRVRARKGSDYSPRLVDASYLEYMRLV